MITSRNPGRAWYGTLAEFNASPSLRRPGDICIPKDSAQIRICDGINVFSALPALPLIKAVNVPALGVTTDLLAVDAVFADLAAARTAVEAVRARTEPRLDAIEAKIDALLAVLVASGQMIAPV